MTSNVYRLPICAGGDTEHRHGAGCMSRLVRALPAAPAGWRWAHGRAASGWSIWLERVGGAGARWHVLGLPVSPTLGGLAHAVELFGAGVRLGADGPTF